MELNELIIIFGDISYEKIIFYPIVKNFILFVILIFFNQYLFKFKINPILEVYKLMELRERFMMIGGILLLITVGTRILLIFVDDTGVFIFYDLAFPELHADNIGEFFAALGAGIGAGIMLLLATFVFIGAACFIYFILGFLTTLVRDSRGVIIASGIFTGLSIFLGIRGLVRSLDLGYFSIYITFHLVVYIVVFGLLVYSFITLDR